MWLLSHLDILNRQYGEDVKSEVDYFDQGVAYTFQPILYGQSIWLKEKKWLILSAVPHFIK